jgi:hypothetical protein
MARANLTLDEKIEAAKAAIEKEESVIKTKRERLAKLRGDLAKLESEKARIFSNELMQIIGDCGISSDVQKKELLEMVKSAATSMKSSVDSSFSAETPASGTNAPAGGNTPIKSADFIQ